MITKEIIKQRIQYEWNEFLSMLGYEVKIELYSKAV